MKAVTEEMLRQVLEQCKMDGKSLEYAIQMMQDVVGVDHACVMNFIRKESEIF